MRIHFRLVNWWPYGTYEGSVCVSWDRDGNATTSQLPQTFTS